MPKQQPQVATVGLTPGDYEPTNPYYQAPRHYDDEGEGRKPRTAYGTAITVGSDLIVTVGADTNMAPGHGDRWSIDAFDADGNWLACLAHCAGDPLSAAHSSGRLVELAVAAAVRLFPNHLLTPLD